MKTESQKPIDREKHRSWVQQIAKSVRGLPQLPTMVAKLLEMIDDPRTNAPTLGKLISTDQVLTSRILRYANSAFYGFTRRISTLDLAVVVLGFDTIKELCLGVTMHNLFGRDNDDTEFDMSKFWEHCVSVSVASKMIARLRFQRISGEAFVAGLVHDIGKLILKQHLKREFRMILHEVRESGTTFYEAEERLFGLNHATIGMWLAQHWNLPPQLTEAIAWHHEPEHAVDFFTHAALVHFANHLTRYAKIGYSGDNAIPVLSERVAGHLGLRRTEDGAVDLKRYKKALTEELEKAESFLSVIQGVEPENVTGPRHAQGNDNGRNEAERRIPSRTPGTYRQA